MKKSNHFILPSVVFLPVFLSVQNAEWGLFLNPGSRNASAKGEIKERVRIVR